MLVIIVFLNPYSRTTSQVLFCSKIIGINYLIYGILIRGSLSRELILAFLFRDVIK